MRKAVLLMRFGVCAPVSNEVMLGKIGFDYVEVNASLLAMLSDEEFAALCAENAAAPIHAEAANCLFPGDLRLTGETADFVRIEEYIHFVMQRLEAIGAKTVVFGNGASRRVPDGFPVQRAREQLIAICRTLGEIAAKHGIIAVLEPLCRNETNILNTQPEGLAFVRAVSHPNFQLLCDYYHLCMQDGTLAMVEECGDALRHIHISNPIGRVPMSPKDSADYTAFFDVLRRLGYDARVSFEGNWSNRVQDLPAALAVLKNA